MKRLLVIVALASLVLAAGATLWAQDQILNLADSSGGTTARANHHPVNQSGIKGRVTYTQTGAGRPIGISFASRICYF